MTTPSIDTMRAWNDTAVRPVVREVLDDVRRTWAESATSGTRPAVGTQAEVDAVADLVASRVRVVRAEVLDGRRRLPRSDLDTERVWRTVRDSLMAEMLGLGRIQPLLDDPTVTDIHVNAPDRVVVTLVDGRRLQAPAVADDDAELVATWQQAARRKGTSERPWDDGHPEALVDLPSGHRVTLVRPPMVRRPAVTVRRPTATLHRLSDLVTVGAMTVSLSEWLSAAVRSRLNVVVAGDQGAGKTTVMRAMLNEIGPDERLVTIEEGNYELLLSTMTTPHGEPLHPDLVEMMSQPDNTEGAGGWTVADLLRHSKRQNADRVVVGEVRDAEASQMVDAMIASTGGSMCTVHAKSARDAISRLRALMTRHGSLSEGPALELLVAAVDLVVFCDRDRVTGVRSITEVVEVAGIESGRVQFTDVWSGAVGRAATVVGPGGSAQLRQAVASVGPRPRRMGVAG